MYPGRVHASDFFSVDAPIVVDERITVVRSNASLDGQLVDTTVLPKFPAQFVLELIDSSLRLQHFVRSRRAQ